ncbi:hypothetical protein [Benzoatithermus flavus]|uniref:Uncharacterized protein n=1 Tax=Benzoatithermus flavus TaxID=3108223 RepID=A0ABU8XWN5_9PROT
MDAEKLGLLVDRLAAADAAGKLRWARGINARAYQASFPSSTVILEYVPSGSVLSDPGKGSTVNEYFQSEIKRAEGIVLRVLDEFGRDVAEISARELEEAGDLQRAALIKQLYERAHYEAGGERVIDELLASLTSDSR